jgi:hypothetical protein
MSTEDASDNGEASPTSRQDNEAFLAWLETVPDPVQRYSIATSSLEAHQEMVTRLSALRAGAVADASQEDSVSAVAERFGMSRQRAYQLLNDARARGPETIRPAAAAPTPPKTKTKTTTTKRTKPQGGQKEKDAE